MKNGVNRVARLQEVLRLQITAGNSLSHHFPNLFSQLKILGFRLEDHAVGMFHLPIGL
jgi:hypothetical protein